MYQQWNRPKAHTSNGPILFSEIQFVHFTYGKWKAEAAALHMEEHKKYWACSEPLRPLSEEQVHRFCARREFVTICHTNGCKPLAIEAASVK